MDNGRIFASIIGLLVTTVLLGIVLSLGVYKTPTPMKHGWIMWTMVSVLGLGLLGLTNRKKKK